MLGYKYEKQNSHEATWDDTIDSDRAKGFFDKEGLPFGSRHNGTTLQLEEGHLKNLYKRIQLLKYLKDNRFIENFEALRILAGDNTGYCWYNLICQDYIKRFEEAGFEIKGETLSCLNELLKMSYCDNPNEIMNKLPSDTYRVFKMLNMTPTFWPNEFAGKILASECLANCIRDNIKEFEQETGFSFEELKIWFSEKELEHMLLTHEIESTYTLEEFEKAGANFSKVPDGEFKLDSEGNVDKTYRYTCEQIKKMGAVFLGKNNPKLTKDPDKIDRKAKVRAILSERTPLYEMKEIKSSEKYLNAIDALNKAEQNINLNGNTGTDIFPNLFSTVKGVINSIDNDTFDSAFEKGAYFRGEKIDLLPFDATGVVWEQKPFNIYDWYNNVKVRYLQELFNVELLKDVIVVMFPGKKELDLTDIQKAYFMVRLIKTSSFERETGTSIKLLKEIGLEQKEIKDLTKEYSGNRNDRKSRVIDRVRQQERFLNQNDIKEASYTPLAKENPADFAKRTLEARTALNLILKNLQIEPASKMEEE